MYATSQRENFKFKFSNIERWWVLGLFKPNTFWNVTFNDKIKGTGENWKRGERVGQRFKEVLEFQVAQSILLTCLKLGANLPRFLCTS